MTAFSPDQLRAWSGGRWTARPGRAHHRLHPRHPRAQARPDVRGAEARPARRPRFSWRRGRRRGRRARWSAAPKPGLQLPQLVVADPLDGLPGDRARAPPDVHRPGRRHLGERGQDLDQGSRRPAARRPARRACDRGQSQQRARRAADAHPDRSGGAPVCGG